MNITLENLSHLFIEGETVLKNLGYDIPEYEIEIGNSKLNFGCCETGEDENIIRISKVVAQFYSIIELKNTIIHELIHVIVPNGGHRGQWAVISNKFNNSQYQKIYGSMTTTYNISPEHQKFLQKQAKYKMICETCGTETYYQKKAGNLKLVLQGSNRVMCTHCKQTKFKVEVL